MRASVRARRDPDITYHVVYWDDYGGKILATDLDPNGCQNVALVSTPLPARWAAENPDFWSTFAGSLGTPEREIFPYPPPS